MGLAELSVFLPGQKEDARCVQEPGFAAQLWKREPSSCPGPAARSCPKAWAAGARGGRLQDQGVSGCDAGVV